MASSDHLSNLVGAGAGDTPQFAALAFGAITGTTAATANTILTLTRDQMSLKVVNSTDVDLIVTSQIPSATTAAAVAIDIFKAGTTTIMDLTTNNRKLTSGAILGVYRRSGAPTTNEIIVSTY